MSKIVTRNLRQANGSFMHAMPPQTPRMCRSYDSDRYAANLEAAHRVILTASLAVAVGSGPALRSVARFTVDYEFMSHAGLCPVNLPMFAN
jgi:hypothetical protein